MFSTRHQKLLPYRLKIFAGRLPYPYIRISQTELPIAVLLRRQKACSAQWARRLKEVAKILKVLQLLANLVLRGFWVFADFESKLKIWKFKMADLIWRIINVKCAPIVLKFDIKI